MIPIDIIFSFFFSLCSIHSEERSRHTLTKHDKEAFMHKKIAIALLGAALLTGCARHATTPYPIPSGEVTEITAEDDAEPAGEATEEGDESSEEPAGGEQTDEMEISPGEEVAEMHAEPLSFTVDDLGEPGGRYDITVTQTDITVEETSFSSAPDVKASTETYSGTLKDGEFERIAGLHDVLGKVPSDFEMTEINLAIALKNMAKGDEVYADSEDADWSDVESYDADGNGTVSCREYGEAMMKLAEEYLKAFGMI